MYRLFLEKDEGMQHLCLLYCEAKGFWWNMFFGWRKTNKQGMYFKFTKKQYERIITAKVFLEYDIIKKSQEEG
jgi:hypothetical protein